MIGADVLFRTAANTAAAAYAARPAYVSYVTHVQVDVPTYGKRRTIERGIEERVAGDLAAIQDLPRGERRYAHAFPIDPTFDPISYFQLRWEGVREAYSWVQDVVPITYASVQPKPGVDVVATSLRYYYATYAPDSGEPIAHVLMQPLRSLTTGNKSDFYLRDVWIDTRTNLPTRVVYDGPDTTFDVAYVTVQSHPVIDRVVYHHVIHGPLRFGRVEFSVDARYTDYAFPAAPSDPRLASGAPTPSAT